MKVKVLLSSFVSASENYIFYNMSDWISSTEYRYIPILRWDLSNIPAKTTKTLSFQVKIHWGLPMGTTMGSTVHTLPKEKADTIFPVYYPDIDYDYD